MRISFYWVRIFPFVMVIGAGIALGWLAFCYKRLARIVIMTDSHISRGMRDRLFELIKKYFLPKRQKNITASTLCSFIGRYYPFISRVRVRYARKGTLYISVMAEQPAVLLNNSLVITRDGSVAQASDYANYLLNDLLWLETAPREGIELQPTEMAAFMNSLPPFVHERYTCTWHDKTLVTLHDKQQPTITLKTNRDTIINEQIMNAIKRLEKLIIYRKSIKNLSNQGQTNWCIDLRCKNQLILAQQKGKTAL